MFAASKTKQVSSAANYIEDVFSTYLYTGNGSTQTITNGIDLSTYGGLVWYKLRSQAGDHVLCDTARGTSLSLASNTTSAQASTSSVTSFGSTGFTIGSFGNVNTATGVSWTFRKAPKFFDVVTYTGNGASSRAISHSLASTPGCIIIKRTDAADSWFIYHRSDPTSGGVFTTQSFDTGFNVVSATSSTTFTIYTTNQAVNTNGATYVAYLFAHNAGGFGLTGTDNVISCGSFTTNASGGMTAPVTLGYEPQWILTKNTAPGNWIIDDVMRGMSQTYNADIYPNTSGAEGAAAGNFLFPTATGFNTGTGNGFDASTTYIYIAIRRGPMKTPTTGTSVFTPVSNTSPTTGCLTDLTINRQPTGTQSTWAISRLTNAGLETQSTNAETATSAFVKFDVMTGVNNSGWLSNSNSIWWNFRRAPGFFDVVCSTGTGVSTNLNHNLGVVPELIISKRRNATENWYVSVQNGSSTSWWAFDKITTDGGFDNGNLSSYVTSTTFNGAVFTYNASGGTYVSYLFATVAGVSKVGKYTGTGALLTVNCGFTSGARFVLIKRAGSTGDWYVYDSARGITSGSDPYLLLNSTAAEVTGTNYVDTDTTGFKVTAAAPAGLNANGGTYIFLAIA